MSHRLPQLIFGLVATVATCLLAADDERLKFFESEIRPLLITRCYKCHGQQSVKGKLRVDSISALLEGGESGAAVVVRDPVSVPMGRAGRPP